MSNLETALKKVVITVPAALKALAAMERQLTSAKTYDDIRRIIKEANALKILLNDVAEVKAAAEDAILLGNRRIAEELCKVPKAASGQKAMALAMLYPKPKQGKKADPELLKKLEKLGTTRHAADQRLSQARAVLD
jgi:hypothetical protein